MILSPATHRMVPNFLNSLTKIFFLSPFTSNSQPFTSRGITHDFITCWTFFFAGFATHLTRLYESSLCYNEETIAYEYREDTKRLAEGENFLLIAAFYETPIPQIQKVFFYSNGHRQIFVVTQFWNFESQIENR